MKKEPRLNTPHPQKPERRRSAPKDKLDFSSIASRCIFKGTGSALSLNVLLALKYRR